MHPTVVYNLYACDPASNLGRRLILLRKWTALSVSSRHFKVGACNRPRPLHDNWSREPVWEFFWSSVQLESYMKVFRSHEIPLFFLTCRLSNREWEILSIWLTKKSAPPFSSSHRHLLFSKMSVHDRPSEREMREKEKSFVMWLHSLSHNNENACIFMSGMNGNLIVCGRSQSLSRREMATIFSLYNIPFLSMTLATKTVVLTSNTHKHYSNLLLVGPLTRNAFDFVSSLALHDKEVFEKER
jgi:hypothetical protein